MNNVKYHRTWSFVDVKDDIKMSAVTQQYQVGTYCIYNGDPSLQCNMTPSQIRSHQKELRRLEKEGKIKDLQFGSEIVVSDKTGLLEVVN